jgi:chloride channel protein, CIC family
MPTLREDEVLSVRAEAPIRRRVAEIARVHEREQTEEDPGARRAVARLRDSELFLLALAVCAGMVAGLGVVAVDVLLALVRRLAFTLSSARHLSADADLALERVLLMPVVGGFLVGLTLLLLRRWRPREVVDAIEANALLGGRMSLGDSLGLVGATILSGGFGASVGMEAAYTQLGAALASRLGRSVELRRDDVRTLVGCGAAGAIAAAFNAPLTGAFYAFELIIGSYTLQSLAPVGIAALVAVLVVRGLVGSNPIFVVWHDVALLPSDYLTFFVLGLASAGLAILVMKGVTSTETLFRVRAVPRWLRPALGGLIVGLMALPFPQILGSGHGGILTELHAPGVDLPLLAGILVAKIIASAVSIGSGFRGGMFSSSLYLGSLFGSLVGGALAHLGPGLSADPLVYTLVGMGSVAAGIVGAPITMIMLVLETTGDFSATMAVMVGVVTASFAVRHWFGYSFATWRFHLRGLKIRSPEDVGWINDLLIGPMMRRDPAVIASALPVDELRRRFPAGSVKQVFVVDGDGRLCGTVDPTGAEDAEEAKTIGDLVGEPAAFLLPRDDLRTALDRFSQAAQEILPVIDNPENRRIIGYLSEAFALRRYAHELEAHRGARQDDAGIFSPAAGAAAPRQTK